MMQKLGDIATYINGYAFKPADRGLKGLPIIRIQDLTGNSYDLGFYDGIYPKKIEINNGDILISWSGSLGIFLWNGGKALLNQHIFKVVFDKKDIDKHYFLFAVKEKLNEMSLKTHGATMKHIIKSDFENITISLPDLNEQKRISNMLLKIENLIKMRKNQIQHYDTLTKSLFIEMFGDPILNPRKWDIRKLNEITALITNGNTPKGGDKNYVDDGILFIRSQNVWKKQLILDDVAYIDTATHKSMKKSSVHNKDILITKTGRVNTENSSLGRAALFCGLDDSANINGHVYLVRLNGTIMPEYVVEVLTSDAYRKYIRKVCVGGIDKRQINLEQVEDFPIIIPPIENQRIFVFYIKNINKHKFPILD